MVIKADLENLLEQVEADDEEICQIRLNIIVFGGRPRSKRELYEHITLLDDRCDAVVSAVRKKTGADVVREDGARLRAIYPRMLAGELSPRRTGQELTGSKLSGLTRCYASNIIQLALRTFQNQDLPF